MAQSVERRLGKAEVTGSIPVSSFMGSEDSEGIFAFCFLNHHENQKEGTIWHRLIFFWQRDMKR